jgi:Sec-independent protein translocase protein TatA
MFDLGPEKIMMILAAVCIFLGPKELPMAARKVAAATRQLRSWQDTLRGEFSSVLSLGDHSPADVSSADVESTSLDAPGSASAPPPPPQPAPDAGDSFL